MKFQGKYYTLDVYRNSKKDEKVISSLYSHLYEIETTNQLDDFFLFPGDNQQQIIKFQNEKPLK
jgi:hypothetical protein